jgi:hypothetical protein
MYAPRKTSAQVIRPLRSAVALSLIWIPLVLAVLALDARAQTSAQEAAQATEPGVAVIPQQVRYAGKLATRAGDTVEAVFRIYSSPEGGEPLWTETQRVTLAEDGSYTVLLGAATAAGLPQTVFAGGAARWLGVSVERGPEADRAMLASVPYAMKSADAEALAGHAASDFVTQAQLAELARQTVPAATTAFMPLTSGSLTGSGTGGTIPLWTGTLTQGNSDMYQVGSDIGINETAPTATLDVGGSANVRGMLALPPVGTATTSGGKQSQLLELSSSAWSTTANAPVAQNFEFLAEPTGNNTATPGGALYLAYQNGVATPTNLLSIASSGQVTFAPGQLFPGTITGAIGTSPITAGVTGHSITVGISPAALEATLDNVFAQTGAANTFHGNQTVLGSLDVTALLTGEDSVLSGTQSAQGFVASGAYIAKPANAATTAAAVNSPFVELTANSYSSSSSASVPLTFAWQAQGSGNNTASPSANLALLYEKGAAGLSPTGLSIASNGSINFSPGQVFPIKGTGGGTITGITTSSPLTGSGTTGSVALGLNETTLVSDITPALEGEFGGVYAVLSGSDEFSGEIIAHQATGTGYAAILGYGTTGSIGTYGQSDTGFGVDGYSPSGTGVLGSTHGTSTIGTNLGPANSWGVWGDNSTSAGLVFGAGILATADDNYAAFFENNAADAPTINVINNGTNEAGLFQASSSDHPALEASNTGGWGAGKMENYSNTQPTLYLSNNGGGPITDALRALPFKSLMATTPTGTCGFGGNGDLSCTGQVKSLVNTAGGARKVETYAMQSPENWMEDFGSGEIQNGVAHVQIDAAFAETVSETADYHVFLTPKGDSKGLYVINETATGFEVRESGGGTSSLAFDYRIVAKRRGYEAQRLVDVTERFNAQIAAAKSSPAAHRAPMNAVSPARSAIVATPHTVAPSRQSVHAPQMQTKPATER